MRIISPKLMLSFHGEDVFSKDSIMCLKLYEYNFEKSIFVGKKKLSFQWSQSSPASLRGEARVSRTAPRPNWFPRFVKKYMMRSFTEEPLENRESSSVACDIESKGWRDGEKGDKDGWLWWGHYSKIAEEKRMEEIRARGAFRWRIDDRDSQCT